MTTVYSKTKNCEYIFLHLIIFNGSISIFQWRFVIFSGKILKLFTHLLVNILGTSTTVETPVKFNSA